MTTLLDRQRAAKLTDAMLTALDLLKARGPARRQPRGWSFGGDNEPTIALYPMSVLVERGLASDQLGVAMITKEGRTLHQDITRGAP